MASNELDVWPGAAAQVEILLEPRFRETRGAFLLALLALAIMAGGGYRWRVGSLRRRERELSRVVRVRTAELRRNQEELSERNTQLATQAEALAELHQARSRVFANVTHEGTRRIDLAPPGRAPGRSEREMVGRGAAGGPH